MIEYVVKLKGGGKILCNGEMTERTGRHGILEGICLSCDSKEIYLPMNTIKEIHEDGMKIWDYKINR